MVKKIDPSSPEAATADPSLIERTTTATQRRANNEARLSDNRNRARDYFNAKTPGGKLASKYRRIG
jgi:hypothetical protein